MTQPAWILVAGLALLTGAAGGVLGSLLLDGEPPVRVTSETPSDGESAAALRDIVAEIRLLRGSIEAGAAAAGAQEEVTLARTPVEGPSSERLERAIDRLAEVLASSGSAGAAPRRPEPPPRRSALAPKSTELLLAVCALSEEERGRTYFFWSRQQFLERFGAPDEIHVQGDGGYSVKLLYDLPEERLIEFWFANDMLYGIDCND